MKDRDSEDKQWAKAYLLDPLTDPEPSQETGIASSHNLAANFKRMSLSGASLSSVAKGKQPQIGQPHSRPVSNYPSPPPSASPSRSSFHPSNPFSDAASGEASPPNSPPPRYRVSRKYPPNTAVTRASSAQVPPQSQRPEPQHRRSVSTPANNLTRSGSLVQRYPGDMSHRPLDTLRKEARAADRAPHLRRKQLPGCDTIDALDTIGGTYHHGGPYDATLASRNRNRDYAPLAAVKDTNMEALRATPRHYLQDSLDRRMPLDGVAAVPNGYQDFRGNTMKYKEGADLMREPDAAGGAYKRWEGLEYDEDDLKGKGPGFAADRERKERKAAHRGKAPEEEFRRRSLVPESRSSHSRSQSEHVRSPSYELVSTNPDGASVQRSNSAGKRITSGFRRRFGSIRRKKVAEAN